MLDLKSEQMMVLADALDKYGNHNQLIICMEELAELTQQISKQLRGKPDFGHTVEEMADVYICMEYLQAVSCLSDYDIQREINVKIERLRIRMQKE